MDGVVLRVFGECDRKWILRRKREAYNLGIEPESVCEWAEKTRGDSTL